MAKNDLSGQVIRGYELRELAGAGGFGAVYRAFQPAVKREVAVKVILPDYADHPEFIRRFEAEAQLIARLEHIHIVPLYDYWREPGGAYLVMRWLRGGSLRKTLEKGQWNIHDAARLVDQIASALAVAHRNDVIHRDLKPDNILLDEEHNAYLADFGIAKHLESVPSSEEDEQVFGSPSYISPEQIRGEPVTAQTDIYSLGIMLYEILTGLPPFHGIPVSTLIFKHLQEPLPHLHDRRPELPAALNFVIQRATAKAPTDRYPNVLMLAAEFRQALAQSEEALAEQLGEGAASGLGYLGITEEFLSSQLAGLEPENPYKGLRAFQEADADDFYGREALVERLLSRLFPTSPQRDAEGRPGGELPATRAGKGDGAARFLAVVGPSGSGKSSVVKAGVIPSLRRNRLNGSGNWFIVEMSPGAHPLEELEAALLKVAVTPPERLSQQLRADQSGLWQAVNRLLPGDDADSELLLLIDQFEETFTQVEDEAERGQFLNSLLAATTEPGSRMRVITTLRADFYDRPLLYPRFGELVRANTEVVLPMSYEELQRAIVEPAENAGLALEIGLVPKIVADVSERPGALPLLQYALTELFERRDGRWLTIEAYDQIGGVSGALARRADELYAALDAPSQPAARQLFLRLVTPGEGTEDTRRRVHQTELLSLQTDEQVMSALIEQFGKYRLLTFDRDPQTRTPTVEIAHEALIKQWERLRAWLNESREDIRMQRRLLAATEEWLSSGKDRSFLASGTRLEQFEEWAGETELALAGIEAEYLQASLAERERRRAEEAARLAHEQALERRSRNFLRALVAVMALATVGALALTGVALNQSQIAQQNAATATVAQGDALVQAEIAMANEDEAHSLALAASAQLARSANTDLAIALAIAANGLDNPPQPATRALAEAAYAPGTRRVLSGHEDWVRAVAVSPDGRLAVSASSDRTLILWDIQTGERIHRLGENGDGHKDWVRDVAFSPDGRAILSASSDQTLILWDVETGEILRRFDGDGDGHTAAVTGMAFSDDGKTAISSGWDGALIVWEIETGKVVRRISDGSGSKINTVALGIGGFTALSGGEDKRVTLWNVSTGEPLLRFEGHVEEVLEVAFTPDGAGAVSVGQDDAVIRWSFETGEAAQYYRGHAGDVFTLAFSPDGSVMATGAQDRSIILWDVATGAQLEALKGHGDHVNSVAFAPDGRTLVSGSADGDVRVWDLRSGAEQRRLEGHEFGIRSIGLNADATRLVSGGVNGEIILWDISQPDHAEIVRRLEGVASEVNDVAFSPDGRLALAASKDSALALWGVESGSLLRKFEGHTAQVLSVAFSPDGRRAVSGSGDNSVIVWDVDSGQAIWRFIEHRYFVLDVAFSPDGKSVLSASADGSLILWDVEKGYNVRTFNGHTSWVRAVAFSPDGQTALSGSADNSLILWDVQTGRPLRQIEGHTAEILSVAFSPDGQTALSSSRDKTIALWDLRDGSELYRYTGHREAVWEVVFSPDGATAFSGSEDRTIRQWRTLFGLDDLLAWTRANRYVRELTCAEREQYRVEPYCPPMTPTPSPDTQTAYLDGM